MPSPGRNFKKGPNADPKVENEAQPQKKTSSDSKSTHFDKQDERSKEAARRDQEHLASGGTIEIDHKGRKSYK